MSVHAARQAVLAAEQRALYGYALVGPRLGAADQRLVRSCLAAHVALRDATAAAVLRAGATPVSPHTDYPELYPVDTVAQARGRAVDLEQTCAAAWRFVYAQLAERSGGPAADRVAAQRALTDSAVRATRWRLRAGDATPAPPFPGIG